MPFSPKFARVAPTFGRLFNATSHRHDRPNVGAAKPWEAKLADLWRERTDNRPWRAYMPAFMRPKVGATPG